MQSACAPCETPSLESLWCEHCRSSVCSESYQDEIQMRTIARKSLDTAGGLGRFSNTGQHNGETYGTSEVRRQFAKFTGPLAVLDFSVVPSCSLDFFFEMKV